MRDVKDIAANLLSEIRNAPRPVVLSPDQSDGDVADIPFFPNPGFIEEERREEERRHKPETKQASLAEGKQLLGADEQVGTHQHEEKRTQEVKKDAAHVPSSEAATIQLVRPGQHYVTAIILGIFLSLVSILFTHLIPILIGVDPFPTPLQVLPPLLMSLIVGFTLGKTGVARPASLLAGTIISISWFVFFLVKYSIADILPYFPPEAWVLSVACTVVCGPLCWLAAWMRTHTHPYER